MDIGFLHGIEIMMCLEPTVLRGIKEDGGITNVIAPILTGSISMDTIVATLMVLIGMTGKDITTHWKEHVWWYGESSKL